MRILNIFFKNINSLEGEGRVQFDQGPIADSGVFAITGPNGSGKSSILDVISLALYGETFRFDKPASHVMTKQTNECFAQVDFALGEERFRSSWSMVGDAGDNPQMTLRRLDDSQQLLAETPTQVRNRIAELTGMDFHKFSKSIMLPQGDFAAFLHALDSERLDILEKISGSDLYDDYRRQAQDQYDRIHTRSQQLELDIASLPLLNQEAVDAMELDLQDFQDQAAELKQQQQELQRQLGNWQNHAAYDRQRQQLERRREELLADLQQDRQTLEKIEANPQANAYRQDLSTLAAKRDELERQRQNLETLRRELSLLQQQLGSDNPVPTDSLTLTEQQQAIDSLKLTISELKLELPRQQELSQAIRQQLSDNQALVEQTAQWLQAHQTDAILLTDFPEIARLRNLRNDLNQLAGKQKSQSNWSKSTTAALKKTREQLESNRDELEKLEAQIVADETTIVDIALGKSFEQWKELLLEQQTRVNEFQEMCELAEVTARLSNKGWFSWFGGGKAQELPSEGELQAQLEMLQQERSREENIIKVLEQAIFNEAMIKKMSADRARLMEGQPCFLCGSLQHPFVSKPPQFNDAKKALIDQRGKIQALKSRIDNLTAQLKTVQKAGTQQSAKQSRLQQIREKWTLLANRQAILRDGMSIGNLSLQRQLLKDEVEELTRISDLVKLHAQLQRNIAKAKTDIERRQQLREKLTQTLAELEANWNGRPAEFTEAEQRLAACQAEEKNLLARLATQLSALGEKMPNKGKENALIDRLNNRRQEYQVHSIRQSALQDENKTLNAKLQDCQETIIAYQQRLTSSLEALNSQERIGLQLTVLEKQKLIADADHQLRILQIELEALNANLDQQLANSRFGNLQQLQEMLQLIDRGPEIEQRYLSNQTQFAELEKQLNKVLEDFHAEAARLGNFDPQSSEQALQSISQRLDIAEQEIRTLQNKLDKQQQYRERYSNLRQQLEQQLPLLEQTASELTLINADQTGLRQRIQQLLVDKLLTHANRHLEKLSSRYFVRGSASDNGLRLEIEDTKQKNQRRAPQTLSGGESFVVSLALALALAEVANNGKAIDSLFIDEGFGNLDAESLYLAMSTLEGLKNQGKTVGVISHVDGVKKRIKTQIELVKKANGLSELKLVA